LWAEGGPEIYEVSVDGSGCRSVTNTYCRENNAVGSLTKH